MRFPSYLRSFTLRLGAVCCLAAFATSVCAQTQHPRSILKLKTCGELEVFEDGTVLESWDGKKTERRLSESRMRRLRKLIAGAPCAGKRKEPPAALPDLNSNPRVMIPSNLHDDCFLDWLGYGGGLLEVKVTLHYPDRTFGPSPVYILCERAKQSQKDQAKRIHQRSLKRNWKRFLERVVSATDSKGLLKDCKCE